MAMPLDLIMVRHGESEGNVALNAAKKGDHSFYTDEFVNKPDIKWSLSPKGVNQAKVAGAWLQEQLEGVPAQESRYYVSPLTRTQQTAGYLDLTIPHAATPAEAQIHWRRNRSIRERDWGDISTMRKDDYRSRYTDSARKEKMDPLYWRPPGGESVADVAENRVRNFLDTLHRECSGRTVVAVSHGEFIRATHLVLTRADDETYAAWESDEEMKIHNCEVFHFSRRVPEGFKDAGEVKERIAFLRRAWPVQTAQGFAMVVRSWEALTFTYPTNEELRRVGS